MRYSSETDRSGARRWAHARTLTAGVPVAIMGSIALSLSTTPAQAVEPVNDRPTRTPISPSSARVSMIRPAEAPPATHTVQRGDTVSGIAAQYGLRTRDVLALNGLSWTSVIYPGQELRLSGATTTVAAAPAATTVTATAGTYTIRAGDTIFAIARRNGVSTQAVLVANGLSAESIIYPGQTITVPSGETITKRSPTAPGLDAEQSDNARLIIQIGRELGVSDRGITIALGTAMQESWLRNLEWGDRDSAGLFQQRPSAGWGTASEIQDAARATRAFFGGASDPNGYQTRGLLDVPGWESLAYADAAQAVQISAYPERYAQWEQPAAAWLAALE